MNRSILKRIEALEHRAKHQSIPELVMIFYRDDLKSWVVQETYHAGGDVYKQMLTKVNMPSEYILPEGFSGTCLFDEFSGPLSEGEYEKWEQAQKDAPEFSKKRIVYYSYAEEGEM